MRRPTLSPVFLAACLALILANPSRAALNRWTSGGPFGGQVQELEFDPGQPGTVYAGTFGGVFRSEDHGATWTSASFGLAGAGIIDLEAVPGSPGSVYVATHEGVQRSDDGGRTWQIPTLTEGFTVNAFALDPSNPQTLYAAIRATIYKSTNGGASWTPRQTLPGTSDATFLEVDPVVPANVYAGAAEGLFRSTDGGTTFTPLLGLNVDFLLSLAIDPVDSRILYAGTSDGVYKSTDRGATWARSGQELADQSVQAVIDPASPSTLLAFGFFTVYRSTDAGGSWTPLFDEQDAFQTIAFDPSSPSTWLLGTSEGIYRSTNQGGSWLRSDTGLKASIVTRLDVDPHRPGTLYASLSGPGDFYKSTDAGSTWSRIGLSNVRAFVLDPKTPSRLYAATLNGLFRSQDGGSTWVLINGTNGLRLAIDPQTPSTLYLARHPEGILKSVDGGLSWSQAGPGLEGFVPDVLVVAPSAPQTLFAGNFREGLFKTTDGGTSWTEISGGGLPHSILNTLTIDPHNADVLYAGVQNERIYKSTDGGATWSFSGNGITFPNVDGIAIDPSQPSLLYATNSTRGIFRSTNAGATWSSFNDGWLFGLTMDQIVLDPVNPFLLYASSHGAGVLARADLQPGSSLRLNQNRFLVKMSWATGQGLAGRGQTKSLTGDTGYASFFQESNIEVLLKVLDACGINGHFWVFAAGLTNVRTDITVADTQTGAVRIYHNPVDRPFQPIQDTSALACSGAASLTAEGRTQAAAAGPILLRDGRFRVTAEFSTAPGSPFQLAEGAPLTGDAAFFWFFDSNNVEVFFKIVDGCPVNDRFWVFAAGLTDVEMKITVEDTKTGEEKVYTRPRGIPFQPIQDTAAFGGCG